MKKQAPERILWMPKWLGFLLCSKTHQIHLSNPDSKRLSTHSNTNVSYNKLKVLRGRKKNMNPSWATQFRVQSKFFGFQIKFKCRNLKKHVSLPKCSMCSSRSLGSCYHCHQPAWGLLINLFTFLGLCSSSVKRKTKRSLSFLPAVTFSDLKPISFPNVWKYGASLLKWEMSDKCKLLWH